MEKGLFEHKSDHFAYFHTCKSGEGKTMYLLSATFRHQFISNKQKHETLTSFFA
jgi:hypothetical protein